MSIQISKVVNALPGTLEADTIYLVKRASGFDMYVTNHVASIIAYRLNGSQIDIFGGPNQVSGTDYGVMTWTKPAGCRFVMVCCIGSGGSGGSGRKGAASTARSGGAGGAGAGLSILNLAADLLAATVQVFVGQGLAPGAAVTTDSTNGNAGTTGQVSNFGTYLTTINNASGGNGGTNAAGGNAAGGTGTASGATGGAPSVVAAGGQGGQAGGTAAGGGGAGGSIAADNSLLSPGAGSKFGLAINNGNFSAAGTSGAPAGVAGLNSGTGASSGATGGSGGYPSKTSGVAGGDGGAGGGPGGGGGGGGAGTDSTANSGAGGRGGNGVVIVMSIM